MINSVNNFGDLSKRKQPCAFLNRSDEGKTHEKIHNFFPFSVRISAIELFITNLPKNGHRPGGDQASTCGRASFIEKKKEADRDGKNSCGVYASKAGVDGKGMIFAALANNLPTAVSFVRSSGKELQQSVMMTITHAFLRGTSIQAKLSLSLACLKDRDIRCVPR